MESKLRKWWRKVNLTRTDRLQLRIEMLEEGVKELDAEGWLTRHDNDFEDLESDLKKLDDTVCDLSNDLDEIAIEKFKQSLNELDERVGDIESDTALLIRKINYLAIHLSVKEDMERFMTL